MACNHLSVCKFFCKILFASQDSVYKQWTPLAGLALACGTESVQAVRNSENNMGVGKLAVGAFRCLEGLTGEDLHLSMCQDSLQRLPFEATQSDPNFSHDHVILLGIFKCEASE